MTDKPRFLITTADERTWKFDRPVLFLGEWCRLYNRRNVWEKLDANVVPPYGWAPGQRDTDYAYVESIYEQLLVDLYDALNRFHGTKCSLRYWRILLGLWLYHFTSIVFNRWSTIQLALRSFTISGTVVLDLPEHQIIPHDSMDAYHRHGMSIERDHAVCARILAGWTDVRCEHLGAEDLEDVSQPQSQLGSISLKRRLKSSAAGAYSTIANLFVRPTDTFIISSCLTKVTHFKLQLAMHQIPQLWRSPSVPKVRQNREDRQNLHLKAEEHYGFEQCVRMLIPEHIPTCYLEGYPVLLETIAKLPWPKRPRVIFTANSFTYDEIFKAWTAAKTEMGVPYVIAQHGGKYGTDKFCHTEAHELATADRYLTWGWSDNNPKCHAAVFQNVIGMPAGQWDPCGGLLLCEVCADLRMAPWDQLFLFKSYLEHQFRFVSLLPKDVREQVTVRLHPAYNTKNSFENMLWAEWHPEIQLDLGVRPIRELIACNRLIVHSYNSTGMLETLALNIPTLVFFDTNYWLLRDSARPYFDCLKDVGIFHETPESAAAKISEDWEGVHAWWNGESVQSARMYFCDKYARVSDSPITELKECLQKPALHSRHTI